MYFFNKFERRIAIFVRHLVKCHANHVTKARILIGWKIATHICQSFTRQIRVCQHEKVGEKVGENRDKFYLSPTVCQHVRQLFLCRSHTPTWVCQHEFANLSLSCEGPFRGKTTDEFIKATDSFSDANLGKDLPIPTVDGHFLLDKPSLLLKQGKFQRIKAIIGVNKDCGSMATWKLYFKISRPTIKPRNIPENCYRISLGPEWWERHDQECNSL